MIEVGHLIFVILVLLYMKTVSLYMYRSLNDFLARQINKTTDGSFVQNDFHRGIMCGLKIGIFHK